MKENPVIYKSQLQVTFKSVVCYYLSITQMVSIGNHHMNKTQMRAEIQAHLGKGVTALCRLPSRCVRECLWCACFSTTSIYYNCFLFDPRKIK